MEWQTAGRVTIDVFLECYRCGSELHIKGTTDNKILVEHCEKCVSEIARLLDSKRQQTQRPGPGHKLV